MTAQINRQAGTFTELVDGKTGHDAHHIPLEQRVVDQRRPHWRCWLGRPHTGQVRRHERVKRFPAKKQREVSAESLIQTVFNAKASIETDAKICPSAKEKHQSENTECASEKKILQDEYRGQQICAASCSTRASASNAIAPGFVFSKMVCSFGRTVV